MVVMKPRFTITILFWKAFYFVFKPVTNYSKGMMLVRTGHLDAYIRREI